MTRAVEWLPVRGYDGYSVSDTGNIWSHKSNRYLNPFSDKMGYFNVTLSRSGKPRQFRVHRLVADAFLGPIGSGQVVRHLNDDKRDNWVENLALGTQSDNMWDIVRNGNHVNANKTHCPRGHEYIPDNTIIQTKGSRACRACHAIAMKASRRKRHG